MTAWRQLRVAFLADYGVGKTTLLKSKAISLALQGDMTCFIFLGGGICKLEPVMGVANEISLGSKPNMTMKSLCHLEQFYSSQHPSTSHTQNKTAIELLKHWIENSTEGRAAKNVFIDEAPIETDSQHKVDILATSKIVADLTSLLPLNGYLWISYHSKVGI